MRALAIIKVTPRRPWGRMAYTGKVLAGYRESDDDYVANNIEAAVALLDREVLRARNARRRARRRAKKLNP